MILLVGRLSSIMGIKFYCNSCRRKLNVKSFLAGKRGVCPHCSAKVDIPYESQIPSPQPLNRGRPSPAPQIPVSSASRPAAATAAAQAGSPTTAINFPSIPTAALPSVDVASEAATAAMDPILEAPDAVWYVRPPSGGQFGPARGEVMRKWIAEGRVSADSLVWREGWADWKLAAPVFPALAGSDAASGVPSVANTSAAVTATSPAAYRSRRRRSNSLAAALTIVLVIMAIVALGVLIWVVQS